MPHNSFEETFLTDVFDSVAHLSSNVVAFHHSNHDVSWEIKTEEKDMFTCRACNCEHPYNHHYGANLYSDEGEVRKASFGHIVEERLGNLLCLDCFNMLSQDWTPRPTDRCVHCGVLYANDEGHIPVEHVCYSCFTSRYSKCQHCGGFDWRIINLVLDKKGLVTTLCRDCSHEFGEIRDCFHCGNKHTSNNALCPICQEELFLCGVCKRYDERVDKRVITLNLYGTPTDVECCGHCSNKVFQCKYCHSVMPIKEKYSGTPYCWTCAATEKGIGEKRAHNYSPAFYNRVGKSNNNLYFGIENEITVVAYEDYQTSHSARQKVKRDILRIIDQYGFNTLFIKHDGTIGGEPAHGATGFEVVLQPHTFKSLKTTDWSGIFPTGVERHPTCGMHIHLNKGAFNTFHLYKFLEFVYNNQDFITFIGEREYTQYCTPNPRHRTKVDAKEKLFKSKGPEEAYRRQAINLCNPDTVELRFFCNAENESVMMKNVEFCHALYMFTKTVSAKQSASIPYFKTFVAKFPKKYPNLIRFLGGSI